jgi:cell division transport system permease protein
LTRRIPLQPETRAVRLLSLTVMALMVGLGIMALAGALALRHVDLEWRHAMADRWTVELNASNPEQPVPSADVARAVALLRSIYGVAEAHALPPEQVRGLLQPWLGDAAAIAELPLPVLIDVTLNPDHRLSSSEVADEVARAIPGARLDDHGAWTQSLIRLARTGEVLGLALLGVIALTIMLTVTTTGRARLAVNRAEIELLHELGASDGYISFQFSSGALRLASVGAVTGIGLSILGLGVLIRTGSSLTPLVPKLWLSPVDFAVLALVPVAAVLLAIFATHRATRALMRRLP